ncbi:MAG: DUF2280 domain-containing protein [Caenibius sp.]
MGKPLHPASRTPARPKLAKPRTTSGCLDEQTRAEIVTRLAMFDSVKAIWRDLKERGVDVSSQAISGYNPLNAKPGLAQKWVDLFHLTREDFLKEIAAEPIAHRAWRLRRLTEDYYEARSGPEPDLETARKILEQAAKEVGNVYTNISKVQGAILPAHVTSPDQLSFEENRNMLADRLSEVFQKLKAEKSSTH